jgi:signal transduction histidine kinase
LIKKLRIQLICVNMVIVAIMLSLLIGMLVYFVKRSVERQQFATLHRIANGSITAADVDENRDGKPNPLHFTVEFDDSGKLRGYGESSYDLKDEDFLRQLYRQAGAADELSGVLLDYNLRFVRAETERGPKFVFADMSFERAAASGLIEVAMLLGVVFLGGMYLVSLLLASWVARPVERAWKQQKQFIADVSHELKTPLTVIVSNAELLQQPGYNETQRAQFNDNILTMTKQMRHLVDSMLLLARVDNPQGEEGRVDLDFSAMVEDCILPFEPLFFERGLAFESEIEPNLHVQGNEQALRRCVDILLDNAQKYSEPGTVRLRLRKIGRLAELSILNPSPPFDKQECEEIFRRFYRRDEARTYSGGYGLGLPIAKGIVERHGGKLFCEWENGEISFTASVPIYS